MTHEQIAEFCCDSGMDVMQVPSDGLRRCWLAYYDEGNPRVYWSTSLLLGMLGLPRVICKDGHDTHARTIKEIAFLIKPGSKI